MFISNQGRALRRLRPLILCLAAGEMLVDKAPGVPNRTDVAPLMVRAAMGALVAVATRPHRRKGGALLAAGIGALAAGAGTLVAFQLRRVANQMLGNGTLANAATGALEDGLAVACGRSLTA